MDTALTNIVKIQHEIQELLKNNNGVTCHFIQNDKNLSLITFNPSHGETFLFHLIPLSEAYTVANLSQTDKLYPFVYEQMLEYVRNLVGLAKPNYAPEKKSYTVTWVKKDGGQNKSYFYGADIREVLDKFYYGKNPVINDFNILEIKLNPIA